MLKRKAHFYQLWHRGQFGNKLRSWRKPEELPPDITKLMLRTAHALGGGSAAVVSRIEALSLWSQQPHLYHGNELAPDDTATLQGEVFESHEGLVLFGLERQPGKLLRMRDALKMARHYTGLSALLTLQRNLDASSMDDLRRLLEDWPEHVIEFSCYQRALGDLRRNTIFWEVRKY